MKVKNKNRKRLNEPRSKYAQFVQNCLALYGTENSSSIKDPKSVGITTLTKWIEGTSPY